MIRLTRSVTVSSFDVEATVAVGRDRPELLAVARLAADLGRPIGSEDVLRELLGPRPDVLGWRVIERCVTAGILERKRERGEATLSALGRVALEHGEVLVPQEGIWRFFFAEDPLIPAILLDVQTLRGESAREERGTAKEARSRGERAPQAERAPALLRECVSTDPRSSIRHGHLFQVREVAEKGMAGPETELRLTLTWDETPALRLAGSLPQTDDEAPKAIDASLDLPSVVTAWNRESLWRALVSQETGVPETELDRFRRIAQRQVLPATFQSLPEAARRTFRRDLAVGSPDIDDLGEFDATTLKDVPVVPSSEADAQAWLSWLEWDAIRDYTIPGELEARSRELRALFPHHAPRARSAMDLLAKARVEKREDRSWFLLAPMDLGLWSSS